MTPTAQRILQGDIRAISRAATLIENHSPHSDQLLSDLKPHTGRALLLGITGSTGSGKSTLTAQLITAYRRQNKKVAVIAVDPSSPFSGGALLGDRIRMQEHFGDSQVFIRSMATRGSMGGIARTTRGLTELLDAAGFDIVIIETVGVGQQEVEIARLAQVVVLILTPGTGDDVQAIKAGIMEIANVFVVNKADLPGADKLERELHPAIDHQPVIKTIAAEGKGIDDLLEAIRTATVMERSAPQQVKPVEIDHLGIAVKSIEQALPFYRDLLSLPAPTRETVEQEKVNVAMLPLNGPRIELLEASDPTSVIAKFIEKRGEGIHHIALKVPDLAATVERLRAEGAKLLNEPRQGAGGHTYVFVHPSSTGGVLLELIQS